MNDTPNVHAQREDESTLDYLNRMRALAAGEPEPTTEPKASDLAQIDTSALTIPAPGTVWPVTDYLAGGVYGGSAQKLSESFVAPLVAAARGYQTFDRDTIDEGWKALNLGDRRSNQARRVAEAIVLKDLLVMPWYAVDEVCLADTRGSVHTLGASSIQVRPSAFLPSEDPDEKKRKYEFLRGSATPVAMHPAIPGGWADSAPTVLIAEGLLKADAALTGWLLSVGVERAQLGWAGGSTEAARATLRGLLAAVPEGDRLCVMSIAGVWNWQHNPEWKMLSFTDRDVWLGIDGDVAVNAYVWKAAAALKDFLEVKKRARVSLLSPSIVRETSDGVVDEKIGLDDYLAEHGSWDDLLGVLSPTLPPRPSDADAQKGDVRVSASGTGFETYTVVQADAAGHAVQGRWVDVEHVDFGLTITGSFAIMDEVNGALQEHVHNANLTVNEEGVRVTRHGSLIPDAVLSDHNKWPLMFTSYFGDGLIPWDKTRDECKALPAIVKRIARASGLTQQGAYRHTGIVQQGRAFASPGAIAYPSGSWEAAPGAVFPHGSAQSKVDFTVMTVASAQEVRSAVLDVLEAWRLTNGATPNGPDGKGGWDAENVGGTGSGWFAGIVGNRSWVMAGHKPNGAVMGIGEKGSGKSTVQQFSASSNGPRVIPSVVFGMTKAALSQVANGLHGLCWDLDDYKPNRDERADADTVAGLEMVLRRAHDEGAGPTKMEKDAGTGKWSSGVADRSRVGFNLTGELLPERLTGSSAERVLTFQHKHAHLLPGAARRIEAIKATGSANVAFGGYASWVLAQPQRHGHASAAEWRSAVLDEVNTRKETLVKERGWTSRAALLVASLERGVEDFLSYAEAVTMLDLSPLKAQARRQFAEAMETHIRLYMAAAHEDGERSLIEAAEAAIMGGRATVLPLSQRQKATRGDGFTWNPTDDQKRQRVIGVEHKVDDALYVCVDPKGLAEVTGIAEGKIKTALADMSIAHEDGKRYKRLTIGQGMRPWLYWVPSVRWHGSDEA